MTQTVRLNALEQKLMSLRSRRGTVQFAAWITVWSVVMSVVLTTAITVAVGANAVSLWIAIGTGALVPAIVAPLVSLGAARMLGHLDAAVRELDLLAHVDSLTGVSSRRHFFSVVPAMLAGAAAARQRIYVGMVDVDDFKIVNDTLGHGVGDDVLRCLTRQLREAAGPDAVIARLGGDEFGLVLHDEPDVERRIAAVESACHLVLLSDTVGARASMGLVEAAGLDLDDALRKADTVLYSDKGRVVRAGERA